MASDAPLAGRRIAVPRPAGARTTLIADLIRALGGDPLEAPVIAFEPAPSAGELDRELGQLARYDWIVVTSATAVDVIADRLTDRAACALETVRLAAVGPATAAAAAARLRAPDFIPTDHQASTLGAELLAGEDLAGCRVLLPLADLAGPALAGVLRDRGADVTAVMAYRTVPGPGVVTLGEELLAGRVDALLLTSGSTASYLADWLDEHGSASDGRRAAGCARVFCIGPAAARTAQDRGFKVTATAPEHTGAGLVRTMVRWFEQHEHQRQERQRKDATP